MEEVNYETKVCLKKIELKGDGQCCDFCGQTRRIVYVAQRNQNAFICELCIQTLSKLPCG